MPTIIKICHSSQNRNKSTSTSTTRTTNSQIIVIYCTSRRLYFFISILRSLLILKTQRLCWLVYAAHDVMLTSLSYFKVDCIFSVFFCCIFTILFETIVRLWKVNMVLWNCRWRKSIIDCYSTFKITLFCNKKNKKVLNVWSEIRFALLLRMLFLWFIL